MVHTASHARQETGKKRNELQSSTKASTIWRIKRMYTMVTAVVFHSSNPMNKTLRHKSTRPKSNPTLPAKLCVLTCYHGTASLSSDVRTMAYFTLLATGKTLTHQITVLLGDTVWLPDLTLISYHLWCYQTRFYFHALYNNITSLFTHHQLSHKIFSKYATWCTPLLETAIQLFPAVYLPSVPQVPLPHTENHSVSRMCIICLINIAKCKDMDDGWCFRRPHFVTGISTEEKILIVNGNCSVPKNLTWHVENVEAMFLPLNYTWVLQPLVQGIIHAAKCTTCHGQYFNALWHKCKRARGCSRWLWWYTKCCYSCELCSESLNYAAK